MNKLILSLCLMFSLPALALNDSSNQDTTSSAAHVANQAQNRDTEIIAFLIVLNNNELAAAKKAFEKNLNQSVSYYAKSMQKDHSSNLADTLRIVSEDNLRPAQTALVASLKQEGKKELDSLSALSNEAFQKAYIDAMVKDHTKALLIIDNHYLKQVTNPQLKNHLELTRKVVNHHLHMAKTIQKEMNPNS
ncbi:DUF4142 domain-containing protein [Legionella taurinensis]|uniref:DUF4142 domain-containing protein n=1 Tax=Legionella taurinensis TaxID=70611 RepID=A0A3A5L2G5_9GAMM|nr:DUF4142 domain-containing protein [Legionella taurinensis]MDX1838615.1 DUF4142 domain-containing protein [Legionella taurinensis]PUT39053.1 hypothetical protein DB744_11665 [Legionella taurinensis]PUT41140.1 hypothetical protein DB746_10055 [Legionella taurinensis]PUT43515.1 hypothetical protein DB743_11060 [Legionella taurinensis]PUT46532.1 hypothetical protein DB745_10545 [Legionella taurinensis]